MPVLDGWEFLEEYSELIIYRKSQVIIVMMSTSFNPDDEDKAKGIDHVTCYKSKPMTFVVIDQIKAKIFQLNSL